MKSKGNGLQKGGKQARGKHLLPKDLTPSEMAVIMASRENKNKKKSKKDYRY